MYSFILLTLVTISTAPTEYFAIRIVDEETGRGVPLVELRTVGGIRYYTDSAGYAAIHEPGLMDRDVYFHISSHGYEFPKDGFGYQGRRLKLVPGGEVTLRIKRLNLAERLYRMTGGGIYRDSILLGKPIPTENPVLNGKVLGSDSVVNAVFQGKLYWFWGDTNRPRYPLGNFHVPRATSELPEHGGLHPDAGVNLDYFVDGQGFAKTTCNMPGKGPTWINGLVVIDDGQTERLFAKYVKVKPPMIVYERGLVEFDVQQAAFQHRKKFDFEAPLYLEGHPVVHETDGQKFVYCASPYPFTRVAADVRSLGDSGSYETYTYLKAGSRKDALQTDRTADGSLTYGWKRDSVRVTAAMENRLIREGKLDAEEGMFQIKDVASGKVIRLHGGSVYWNQYRKRWIMIALESMGSSLLGELWYSESPALTGPWSQARKIVTHTKYSFYNPKQHPMFDQENGRFIYFEGTYTNMFSGNPDQTPRYNYNQIMYRLDLEKIAQE